MGLRGAPVKRSVTIRGHRTSISMETEFWDALHEIAAAQKCSVSGLIAEIDAMRLQPQTASGLSSAVRVYVLSWYRERAGHLTPYRLIP
jgi:predicted DNA-binding ribbon-helix-helix protein